MCGIAGIFHYADPDALVDRELLVKMTRALEHRGPDDEGFFVDGGVGFGHRRLSIVDLSPTGHQPMSTDDGRYTITYNGELYNHQTYRASLASRGVTFRGTSDTESLLKAIATDGPGLLESAAGIFGFALFDKAERRVLLARDPLGVKQVYFHDDGRRVVFASEIKALLVDPSVRREIDPDALNDYIHFHTPLFERTFFRGIRQLRQGEYVWFDRGGPKHRRYWTIDDFSSIGDARRSSEELQRMLGTVVGDQLMSDVPVASFFSGGIDSSAVAEFARRNGRRPLCFGVHFTDQGVIDERPYQEAAASALGLELELITVDGSRFPADFERLMYYQDQPLIGPALIPMYYVSKLASSKVKVCLGGQGADEIFGGYARYALTRPFKVLRNSIFGGRDASSEAAAAGGNLRKQLSGGRNLGRLLRAAKSFGDWKKRYVSHFATVEEATWLNYFANADWISRRRAQQIFNDTVAASGALDPGTKAMHWDVQTYLPGLFQQDDRMSMANSLESRVPISDPRLVKLGFRIDFDYKFKNGSSKWILRQAVSNVLPEFVLNRRKVGFDTPVRRWLTEQHRDFLVDTLTSKRATERGLWRPDSVRQLATSTGDPMWLDVAWKVLSVEVWARTMLDRAPEVRIDSGIPRGAAHA